MFIFKLLSFLILAAHSMLISALNITVPLKVSTPGPVVLRTVAQPGDSNGDHFYSVSNTINSALPSYNLTSGANDALTFSLTLPLLPGGSGWVVTARNSSNVIGTSNTFSVVNLPPPSSVGNSPPANSQVPNSSGTADGPFGDPSDSGPDDPFDDPSESEPDDPPTGKSTASPRIITTPPEDEAHFSTPAKAGTAVGIVGVVLGTIRLIFCGRRPRDSTSPSSVEAGQQAGPAPWISFEGASISSALADGVAEKPPTAK
ncbi:hypothetical protein B0H13DRAFT_2672867 [Mycena leptocephala]|nr:hypothetical protein B0H13DRAFT_2672867 [Mycena leptocephala]